MALSLLKTLGAVMFALPLQAGDELPVCRTHTQLMMVLWASLLDIPHGVYLLLRTVEMSHVLPWHNVRAEQPCVERGQPEQYKQG